MLEHTTLRQIQERQLSKDAPPTPRLLVVGVLVQQQRQTKAGREP